MPRILRWRAVLPCWRRLALGRGCEACPRSRGFRVPSPRALVCPAAGGASGSCRRSPPKPNPSRRVEDEAAHCAETLPAQWKARGRPFERDLLDASVAAYRELGSDQEEAVVCHQDFHGGNVLRATREEWLAIDPKPLVGERAFDTAWLLRDRRASVVADARPSRRLRRRLDLLSAELELDRERMR